MDEMNALYKETVEIMVKIKGKETEENKRFFDVAHNCLDAITYLWMWFEQSGQQSYYLDLAKQSMACLRECYDEIK